MILPRRFPPGAHCELDSGTPVKVLYVGDPRAQAVTGVASRIGGHRRYVSAEHWAAWVSVTRLRQARRA